MSPQALQDLLELVGEQVPLATIQTWSPNQIEEAHTWAYRSYLKASDNHIRVPPKPYFLINAPDSQCDQMNFLASTFPDGRIESLIANRIGDRDVTIGAIGKHIGLSMLRGWFTPAELRAIAQKAEEVIARKKGI